jgi:hypothetical protein
MLVAITMTGLIVYSAMRYYFIEIIIEVIMSLISVIIEGIIAGLSGALTALISIHL